MFELFLRILGIMTPGICLATIGVFWKLYGPEYQTRFVTTLVLNVAMPPLVFHTLVTSDINLESIQIVGLATLAVHLIVFLVSLLLMRLARKDVSLAVAFVVGNTGNLGLPICFFAFGQEGLAYAIVYFSVQSLMLFSFGDAVYAGNADFKRMVRMPIIYAILMAVLVKVTNFSVPTVVLDTTGLLGQLVIPVMLITLGVSIAGMRAAHLSSTIIWSVVRTVLALVVALGVVEFFDLEGVARGVVIIETTVPVAVFNFLLATRHGRDSTEVSGLILVTHLGALVYLPLLLAYLL